MPIVSCFVSYFDGHFYRDVHFALMISIIICSRNKHLPENLLENIEDTIGVDYEIIAIDNSEQKHSIFSAYNLGVVQSKFSVLCFVHEDVFFHSKLWGEKIISHLSSQQTGIIGLAGSGFIPQIPTNWLRNERARNIIQSSKAENYITKHFLLPENYTFLQKEVVALDGVFLCMRRDVFDHLRFDESLGGFHAYDLDISIQSYMTGYKNYVVYDILVEHFSRGNFDKEYFVKTINVFKKWENHLPLSIKSLSDKAKKPRNHNKSQIDRLTKILVRKGFCEAQIIENITYFTTVVGTEKDILRLRYLPLKIKWIRFSSKIRNKK